MNLDICPSPSSHVAAVLFATQTNALTKCQFSSTSLQCSWLPPSFSIVKFDEICNIDFTTPQSKRKSSDNDNSGERSITNKKPRLEIPKPTEEDLGNHHLRLSRMKGKPILLSFVLELNESYEPKLLVVYYLIH